MPMDRFLIAPFDENSGLNTSVRPWLISDSAFSTMENAYVFRGRVRKRFGSRWLADSVLRTRLRLNVGNTSITLTGPNAITSGIGNATGTVPGTLFQLGQRFVIGAEIDTVTNPAAGAQAMTSTGPSVTHTYDITNGNYVFVGAPINTQIYFFPNPEVTSAAGSIAGILPYAPIAIGTMFSIDDVQFTVNALGTPANLLICNGSATTATLDTTTGAFTFTGVMDAAGALIVGSSLYFYPSLPVMGILDYDTSLTNDEFVIAFDTKYAYRYLGGWERLNGEVTAGASTWTGTNSEFFWSTVWTGTDASQKVFFVTNFNENEPNFMRYFVNNVWDNFRPAITGTDFLNSAQILVVFKNRLLALNTWEGSTSTGNNYQNRCRYAQVGSPLDANSWRQDITGRGNAIDAATAEAIITVEFIKDRLIVFFERSTWELVFTGNQAYPFTWQKINTELGAESPFSIVPFDKVAFGVGNVGIHACNGTNVERIDANIPQLVFDIKNVDQGVQRVYGIRDYFLEMIYWTFPDTDASDDFPFPRKVLTYNYKNGSWALNDDTITCFGYMQLPDGVTWDSTTVTWDDEVSWDSGALQSKFRNTVAGNQQGFVFICDAEVPVNAELLQITDLTVSADIITITSINHNIRGGDFVFIEFVDGTGNLDLINNKIYEVLDSSTSPVTANSFSVLYNDSSVVIAGTYSGCGLISRVSNIVISTKEFNFYAKEGCNAYINKVDFMVDKTAAGQTQINFFTSTSEVPLLQDSAGLGALVGTGTLDTFPYTDLYPYEADSSRLWHPVYFQADGEVIQLQFRMSDEQMMDVDVRQSGFQLHAMAISASKSSSRFQ